VVPGRSRAATPMVEFITSGNFEWHQNQFRLRAGEQGYPCRGFLNNGTGENQKIAGPVSDGVLDFYQGGPLA
jgi:hypothetical protein